MQLCGSLSILWHCISLGLGWKLTFSSPVATAEFSIFADILSVALSQHQLSGFEIAQLELHHIHWLCLLWCFLRPTWLHIPGCLALGEWSHHCDYLGPLPSVPGNHCSTFCFYEFDHSRCLVSEIIQYLSFCDWLSSLSVMPSRFIYVIAGVRISFLFKIE